MGKIKVTRTGVGGLEDYLDDEYKKIDKQFQKMGVTSEEFVWMKAKFPAHYKRIEELEDKVVYTLPKDKFEDGVDRWVKNWKHLLGALTKYREEVAVQKQREAVLGVV